MKGERKNIICIIISMQRVAAKKKIERQGRLHFHEITHEAASVCLALLTLIRQSLVIVFLVVVVVVVVGLAGCATKNR